jgi:hypothetical protein
MKHLKKAVISALLVFLIISSALLASCSAKDGAANESNRDNMGEIAPTAPSDSLTKDELAILPDSSKDDAEGDKENGGDYAPKIIRTFTLNAETKSYDSTITSLYDSIALYKGYVSSSKVTGQSYNNHGEKYSRQATLVIRIPAESVDEFVGGLGGSMNVTSSASSETDVSTPYYSITARMETLNTERQSLLAMMGSLDNASDYNFWYTLQKRISEIEQQLAEYQSQIDLYDNKVSYSTVNLTLYEVFEYTPQNIEEPTFFERISKAFTSGWKDFGEFCMDFAVFAVGALPTFTVFAVIGITALVIVKIARRSKKNK